MQDATPSTQDPNAADTAMLRVEAARYALLRRLAYAMRHHMVVHLQPIGMIIEVAERRLKTAPPSAAQVEQVRDSLGKINGFSRSAVQSCLEVISWLAPDGAATVPLEEGIRDCLSLVRSNFNFRGFTIRDEVASSGATVLQSALRHVLPAAMLALTDHAQRPCIVVLRAHVDGGHAVLALALEPDGAARAFQPDEPYRSLTWPEVASLAAAESIGMEHGDGSLRLSIPLAATAAPHAG